MAGSHRAKHLHPFFFKKKNKPKTHTKPPPQPPKIITKQNWKKKQPTKKTNQTNKNPQKMEPGCLLQSLFFIYSGLRCSAQGTMHTLSRQRFYLTSGAMPALRTRGGSARCTVNHDAPHHPHTAPAHTPTDRPPGSTHTPRRLVPPPERAPALSGASFWPMFGKANQSVPPRGRRANRGEGKRAADRKWRAGGYAEGSSAAVPAVWGSSGVVSSAGYVVSHRWGLAVARSRFFCL